ncbi:MAG: hypothetical protein R2757_22140 [Draconibacterium sp.]
MKTITKALLLFAIVIATSCEGPQGPQGLPGFDGDSFIGSVFEIQGDFTANNSYSLFYEFPSNFEIYDTDVVLVYILWDQSNGIDIWRLMPQTVVLKTINDSYPETDVIQYNFDYTVNDVKIFLETTINYADLLPEETDDQIFRIVVLPADFAAKKSVDINDYNSIIKSSELQLTIPGAMTLKDINK